MSADNYLKIEQQGKGFVLFYGCASNDWRTGKGRFNTLEEAVKEATEIQQDEIIEYGLSISLAQSKASEAER